MFDFTLTLYGGLNHMIFLLRFLLGGGVYMNSIFSLKPLILSALLYVGAALSKYSLPQDKSDILLLTINAGIFPSTFLQLVNGSKTQS